MKDRISALMDGELPAHEAGEAIDWLARDPEGRAAWRAYHLIGEALREPLPAGAPPARPSRWRLALPAMAVAAAVALVSWVAFAPQPQAPAPQMAQEPKPAPVATVPLPSAANDYLLAHQGFSPRVALQGMAPYVRTVSDHAGEARK